METGTTSSSQTVDTTDQEVQDKDRQIHIYNCNSCGAQLKYKPGTTFLVCEYCNTSTPIDISEELEIEELDFEHFASIFEKIDTQTVKVFICKQCGAETSYDENIKSTHCPYCTAPLIESDIHNERLIQPSYLLPFKVADKAVQNYLKRWFKDLWFIPGKLEESIYNSNHLKSIYIPCWTYDAQTYTTYSGRRGDKVKNSSSKSIMKWSKRSGTLSIFFDDVLVPASRLISNENLNKIPGWDLQNLAKIDNRYLSGFVTEKYVINLKDGFPPAKDKMNQNIKVRVKREIGGDSQVIESLHTNFSNLTFKLILLPVYMCSYTYKNKLYHFYMNGRNGIISGKRPYSIPKIVAAIIALLALLVFIFQYAG